VLGGTVAIAVYGTLLSLNDMYFAVA
jgi:hypothetical protein